MRAWCPEYVNHLGKYMDQIANLLISIKNGGKAGKATVVVPHSKIKEAIVTVLKDEGFVKTYHVNNNGVKKTLEVVLTYEGKSARVSEVKRLSKLGLRRYYQVEDIKKIRNGQGLLVLSTPKGILTGGAARKENVGGEALFEIW